MLASWKLEHLELLYHQGEVQVVASGGMVPVVEIQDSKCEKCKETWLDPKTCKKKQETKGKQVPLPLLSPCMRTTFHP